MGRIRASVCPHAASGPTAVLSKNSIAELQGWSKQPWTAVRVQLFVFWGGGQFVLGLIDDTHAAPAEFGEDLVVADGLADHDSQIVALRDTWW